MDALPPQLQVVSRMLPSTYAVSLLRGIWRSDGWLAHTGDVAMLGVLFLIFIAISARVFRWESPHQYSIDVPYRQHAPLPLVRDQDRDDLCQPPAVCGDDRLTAFFIYTKEN
jgi:hypothetical protein